ncbi:MAG TPA: DinB family protein [Fimbriimonadaceae bacterium]|nr:DinB family protein [Fimbriimonadaceae bacterium]HRJ97390.1 DinB family protein [Fimbriimonadaceae bacterium]
MPTFDAKAYATAQVENALKFYRADLEAIAEEDFCASPGGSARAPIDFTYEVSFVNRRLAGRLRGDEMPAMHFEGWMMAPEDHRSKAASIADFESSMNEVLAALGDDVHRPIVTPDRTTTAMEMALFCALHVMYHDAQLNYFQALKGDDKMHWD